MRVLISSFEVRITSTVSAASQQSALDSHRAKDDKLPSHDLVSELIIDAGRTLVTCHDGQQLRCPSAPGMTPRSCSQHRRFDLILGTTPDCITI